MLPDADADKIIADACDLVDADLGPWPLEIVNGRKVVQADTEAWRWAKLKRAALEVGKYLFANPGAASEREYRDTSGDVSLSGPTGSPYGRLYDTLLNESGLVIRFTRARTRGSRNQVAADRFFAQTDP